MPPTPRPNRPESPLHEVTPPPAAAPHHDYPRLKVFGGAWLVLLVCVPVLLLSLGTAEVTQKREAVLLQAARETALRMQSAGDERAWLLPTLHGEYQFDPPPLPVWMQLGAWWGLDVATAPPQSLVYRARLLAVAMALLALACTYWAGMSVGDVRVARLASLALGTTLLFVDQARTACGDTHMLGWVTLAVAAGLWAMRPLKEVNWVGRRVAGWFIVGLALAAATMTQGPGPAALYIMPPLFAAIILTPRRRIDNTLGLIFAVILGVIAASPWYLYVLNHVPETAPHTFIKGLLPPHDLFLITWSHWRVLLVLCPWVVWLFGAMCQPFIRAEHERRRQLLIAWFWLLMVFVFVSIPASRSVRELWPLLPAAALMVGQLWAFHAQLGTQRQVDPGVDWLRVPHWLLLGLVSILGPLLLIYQTRLVDLGYLGEPWLAETSWPIAAAMGATLLLIALLGTRWHYKWRPRAAAYATVAWMLVALAVCLPLYAAAPENRYAQREESEKLSRAMAGRDLYYLRGGLHDSPPDAALLFYAGVHARPLTPEQLAQAVKQNPRIAVATADTAQFPVLESAGLRPDLSFRDSHHTRTVFVVPPTDIKPN